MAYQKGHKPWNAGKTFSEESREKMRQAKLGKPNLALKGRKRPDMIGHTWNKGRKLTEAQKKKLSDIHKEIGAPWMNTPEAKARTASINWKGGITPVNKAIRSSLEYKNWRKSVIERDEYTCQQCGQIGGELQADHIKPFSMFPDMRLDLDNGRTLCKPCHLLTPTWGTRALTFI